MRRGTRRLVRARPALVWLTFVPLGWALVVACVDGTTPDCSDAATQCGPNLDGSSDRQDASQTLPEATPDTSVPDVDAAPQPDADAGDEI